MKKFLFKTISSTLMVLVIGFLGFMSHTYAQSHGPKIDWNGTVYDWNNGGYIYYSHGGNSPALQAWRCSAGSQNANWLPAVGLNLSSMGNCVAYRDNARGLPTVGYVANPESGFWYRIIINNSGVVTSREQLTLTYNHKIQGNGGLPSVEQRDEQAPIYQTGKPYRPVCDVNSNGVYDDNNSAYCAMGDPMKTGVWQAYSSPQRCSPYALNTQNFHEINLSQGMGINEGMWGYNINNVNSACVTPGGSNNTQMCVDDTDGGGGCFIANTMVTLADNSKKPIQDIKVGDKLKAVNGINTVVSLLRPLLGKKDIYSINHEKAFFTANHPFLTTEGWKSLDPETTKKEIPELEVSQLEIGDILITEGKKVIITSLTASASDASTQLYNFELDGDHTYYANNYAVHNKRHPNSGCNVNTGVGCNTNPKLGMSCTYNSECYGNRLYCDNNSKTCQYQANAAPNMLDFDDEFCQVTTIPIALCGSANGTNFFQKPTTNLCLVGSAGVVAGTGPWTWTCMMPGSLVSCSANKSLASIVGKCGSADGTSTSQVPVNNLCDAGLALPNPPTLIGSNYTWMCMGVNGGSDASCSAPKTTVTGTGTNLCVPYNSTLGLPSTNIIPSTSELAISLNAPQNGLSDNVRSVTSTGYTFTGGFTTTQYLQVTLNNLAGKEQFIQYRENQPARGGGQNSSQRSSPISEAKFYGCNASQWNVSNPFLWNYNLSFTEGMMADRLFGDMGRGWVYPNSAISQFIAWNKAGKGFTVNCEVCSYTAPVGLCTAKPANSVRNTVSTVTGNPLPDTVSVYNTVPSSNECRFTCSPGYQRDGAACVINPGTTCELNVGQACTSNSQCGTGGTCSNSTTQTVWMPNNVAPANRNSSNAQWNNVCRVARADGSLPNVSGPVTNCLVDQNYVDTNLPNGYVGSCRTLHQENSAGVNCGWKAETVTQNTCECSGSSCIELEDTTCTSNSQCGIGGTCNVDSIPTWLPNTNAGIFNATLANRNPSNSQWNRVCEVGSTAYGTAPGSITTFIPAYTCIQEINITAPYYKNYCRNMDQNPEGKLRCGAEVGTTQSSCSCTPETYSWDISGWGICNNKTKIKTQTVVCRNSSGVAVNDSLCPPPKPPTSAACGSSTGTGGSCTLDTSVGGSCFIADTLVTLADGSTKPIQDIVVGDMLKAVSGSNTVIALIKPLLGNQNIYSINDKDAFFTANHPFLTTEGWKSFDPETTKKEIPDLTISKLEIGDILITEGEEVLITNVFASSRDADTQLYNFELDGDHTYYANGYAVHNKFAPGTRNYVLNTTCEKNDDCRIGVAGAKPMACDNSTKTCKYIRPSPGFMCSIANGQLVNRGINVLGGDGGGVWGPGPGNGNWNGSSDWNGGSDGPGWETRYGQGCNDWAQPNYIGSGCSGSGPTIEFHEYTPYVCTQSGNNGNFVTSTNTDDVELCDLDGALYPLDGVNGHGAGDVVCAESTSVPQNCLCTVSGIENDCKSGGFTNNP